MYSVIVFSRLEFPVIDRASSIIKLTLQSTASEHKSKSNQRVAFENMPNLFLKRSQVTGTSSNTNRYEGGRNFTSNRNRRLRSPAKPVQGSEAVAVESQKLNAVTFKYPPNGFETWIEHSLLYTMIRESDIFPAETVLQAIDDEDYTQYFQVKEDPRKQQQEGDSTLHAPQISYAQLTALLALAGEEWLEETKVPERLCKAICKQIIKYAHQHDLDRQQEVKELLDPLIAYAHARGKKHALSMLPWFAAISVSVVNPLAFYTTYMAMLAINGDDMGKRDRAERNTIDMLDQGSRNGNVEKASLLDEDHYNDFDE